MPVMVHCNTKQLTLSITLSNVSLTHRAQHLLCLYFPVHHIMIVQKDENGLSEYTEEEPKNHVPHLAKVEYSNRISCFSKSRFQQKEEHEIFEKFPVMMLISEKDETVQLVNTKH